MGKLEAYLSGAIRMILTFFADVLVIYNDKRTSLPQLVIHYNCKNVLVEVWALLKKHGTKDISTF